jgi:hypothetical protein
MTENQWVQLPSTAQTEISVDKNLGTTLTNQNYIHDEIKSRLNSGIASYHYVQRLLSSRLLYKNLKIKIYKTIILHVLCVGVKLGLSH